MRSTIKRPTRPPSPDDTQAIGAAITRMTAGYEQPLRVRWENLSADEARDLIEVVRRADTEQGFGLGHLGKRDVAKFERLAEKGAGREGFFQQVRDAEALRVEFDALRRAMQEPSRRVALAQPGSVSLRKEWVFDFVRSGVLWPSHLAVLTYAMSIFEGGDVPVVTPSVTYDGETITVDSAQGFMPDPGESFVAEGELLDHLAQVGFLKIERRGRMIEIRPGARLRRSRKAA